jgi:hypothetical protein
MTTRPYSSFFEKHSTKIEFGAPSGCWLWSGAQQNGTGYGKVLARGKLRRVHREAYAAHNGEGSAENIVVRHTCDTPLCVNPAHLISGSQADNVRDKVERGRHVSPKGEAHGHSKLTEADVKAIRAAYVYRSKEHNLCAIAQRFGVSHFAIHQIVRRKGWKHLPEGEV